MNDGIQFEEGEFGLKAIVKTAFSDIILESLVERRVSDLELNQAKGWRGPDLRFLEKLKGLRSLQLLDFRVKDISPIVRLVDLENLKLVGYFSSQIDFSRFSRLKSCVLEWWPNIRGLFECKGLRVLSVNRFSKNDMAPFAQLENLESLTLLNAPIDDIRAVSALKKLRKLRLGNLRRLKSLQGIESLNLLEELDIDTCKAISSLHEVEGLSQLRKLYINNGGNIASLKPLEKIPHLETVGFYEGTNIVDGDLSPLLKLHDLRRISFMNRKHYSHRREDFGLAYSRL